MSKDILASLKRLEQRLGKFDTVRVYSKRRIEQPRIELNPLVLASDNPQGRCGSLLLSERHRLSYVVMEFRQMSISTN